MKQQEEKQKHSKDIEEGEESENSGEIATALATLKDSDDTSSYKDTDEDKKTDSDHEGHDSHGGKTDPENDTFSGAGSYKFDSSEHVDEYLKNLGSQP